MKSELNMKYEKCIINIKIIAKLNPYDRLIFGHDYFCIRQYNVLMGFIRYFSGESRKDIINGLNELYNGIESINDEYTTICLGYEDTIELDDKLKILSKELDQLYNNEKKGLSALLITYNSDRSTCAKIEYLIDKFKIMSSYLSQTKLCRQSRTDRSKSE